MIKSRLLWISTVTIFASSILNTFLHECGHYLTALIFNAQNLELHHNYVSYDDLSIGFWQRIIVAGAGPIISLLIGILGLRLHSSITSKGWKSLFLLWLSFHALLTFLGYVLIAPIFSYGDTGFIFNQLHFPMWLMILLSVLSFVIMFFIFDRGGKRFLFYFENEMDTRQKTAQKLFLWPIFISTICGIFINLPAPTILSLIAPATMPFAFFSFYGGFLRGEKKVGMVQINKFPLMLIIICLALVLLFRFLV